MRRFILTGLLALTLAACAGNKKEPDTAAGPAGAGPAGGQPVASGGGQQYAMGDELSSGEASNRPRMNAAAAQAYQAGLQAFQAGDLKGAKAQFSKAASADSNAYQAQFSLGVVEERLGNTSGALSAYRAAVSIVPDYEPAIVAYAMVLARTGREGDAETYLNTFRAKMPKSAAVLAALAEVKSIQKDSASAQELAQRALKNNPDYRPAMVTLARDHYRNRRLDLALYALTAILDGYGPENPPRDKDNAEALMLRALIEKEQGKRKQALADFQRALELRPDMMEARLNLAKYMLEAGNADAAVPVLEKGLSYDPKNVLLHLDLGDAYRLQGKVGDARQHLEWVISADSSMAQAHYNLGLLYLFTPNIPGMTPEAAMDKAIAHLERFKEMRPRSEAGTGDDVDELLARAKNKKSVLQAMSAAPPPPADDAAPPPEQ